jgi:hypothetical protein
MPSSFTIREILHTWHTLISLAERSSFFWLIPRDVEASSAISVTELPPSQTSVWQVATSFSPVSRARYTM